MQAQLFTAVRHARRLEQQLLRERRRWNNERRKLLDEIRQLRTELAQPGGTADARILSRRRHERARYGDYVHLCEQHGIPRQHERWSSHLGEIKRQLAAGAPA